MTKKPRTELKHIRMAGHVSGWKTDVLNIQILETSGSILWCFEDQKASTWMRNVLLLTVLTISAPKTAEK